VVANRILIVATFPAIKSEPGLMKFVNMTCLQIFFE
jgi:hypothetical protein